MKNRPVSRRSGKALLYLLVALVAGAVGGISVRLIDRVTGTASGNSVIRPYTLVRDGDTPVAEGERVVQVVKNVGPAVISIDTLGTSPRQQTPFPFGPPGGQPQQGQGTGFIINASERLAVTNNHVVERADRIRVTLADKRVLSAEVIGSDAIGDIALIKISGDGDLAEIPFADSDELQIGQIAVAIGNPLGLEQTVTQGVLSAVGRSLPEGHVRNIPLEDLIQTDAAINPGNSGGPLLDAEGRVIGMNTAIIAQAQGIGFAVASNSIQRAVSDILEHGRVIRPWIGVSMRNITPPDVAELGLSVQKGVLIWQVRPGEPADRAGLRRLDVIQRANGTEAEDMEELRRVIRALRPGDTLRLEGLRDQAARRWEVRVGEMPPPDQLGG
jgi:serine protease Do